MKKKSLVATIVAAIIFSSQSNPFKLIEISIPFQYNDIIIPKSLNINQSEKRKKLEQKIEDLINYRISNFNEDTETRLLARLILGEAEGCSDLEKISVAYTVINRTKSGKSLKDTILAPYQYSCFNENFDSSKFLKNPLKYNPAEFRDSLIIAEGILAGKYKDPTKGATHYYNPNLVKQPLWAKKLTKIGRIKNSHHSFYK